ncbi:MAG: DUF2723 domain-containing protein [Candidatus Cloacimonetes bacterium]|nr:DUF2723 domain-containing protein [Candidatus Cloacimonadota bacterium]
MNYTPQPVVNKRINSLVALSVFLGSLLVYYLTVARSLSFWDAGEYITCSSILGVPHPPGNPFYIILGRFFAALGGTIPHAFLINFVSGILSAFAVMFTYLFTVKFMTMWISEKDAFYIYLGGFIAAFYTAFSFTFWNNAIEAEVYSGLAFTLNLIVWLTMLWVEKSRNFSHQNLLLLVIYIFFLGFGIHQTSLQIAPAVLFIAVYPFISKYYRESKTNFWIKFSAYLGGLIILYLIGLVMGKAIHVPDLPKYLFGIGIISLLIYHLKEKVSHRTWYIAFFLIFIAVSTHFFLLVRSEFRPFINEGHPSTLEMFKDYILRTQYGPTSMFERRATFFYQMKDQFLTYSSWQFFHVSTIASWFKAPENIIRLLTNLFVLLLGLQGIFYQYKKNKHSFAYFFAFFFMASIAMVFIINLSDAEVRERDYFFVTAYNFWTFWLAVGSISVIIALRKIKKATIYFMIPLSLLFPALNLTSQYFIHDRSQELIALDYGQNMLNSLEENAILFTNGDNDTFPLWYAQAVFDPNAKAFTPLPDHARPKDETIYIDSISSQKIKPTDRTIKMINKAMEFKNRELFGIRKDVTIANLSLLNTPWYIKQLRDLEGIEFNRSERDIEECQTNPRSKLYPRRLDKNKIIKIKGATEKDDFTIKLKKDRVLYVKDLAVIQLIRDNYGKRPIYFAVTVSDVVGFDDHLMNEGMVDRLVATKGGMQINMERLTENINEIYSYRGVFDDKIYKDPNMLRLLNNYGAAYLRAATYYQMQNNDAGAISSLEKGVKFISKENRSVFYRQLSNLYLSSGFKLVAKDSIDAGFSQVEKAIDMNKRDRLLPSDVYKVALYSKEYERGISLLNKLNKYQDNPAIDELIGDLRLEIKLNSVEDSQ